MYMKASRCTLIEVLSVVGFLEELYRTVYVTWEDNAPRLIQIERISTTPVF